MGEIKQIPYGVSDFVSVRERNLYYVDKTMYSAQIADLISALIIYLCGFVLFIKNFMDAHAAKKEERTKTPAAGDAGKGGDQ